MSKRLEKWLFGRGFVPVSRHAEMSREVVEQKDRAESLRIIAEDELAAVCAENVMPLNRRLIALSERVDRILGEVPERV